MQAVTAYNGSNTYSYDASPAKNQIVGEQSTRNGGYNNGFGYDSAGNPTTYVGVVQHFNSDNQNTASGYVYDGNGNPTTYQGSSFAFDAVNRLSSIGSTWTAGYTGEGLRAWQQNSGTTTYYLYDGSVPVCELNSSGAVTATNTFGAAGLLSRHTSSSLFYSFDPTGNVAETHNSSGTPQVAYQFYSFGQYHASTTPSDPFGFGGQAGYTTDRSTGLVLLGHRYYDPGQGRFLNRDPISYAGGINLYSYVGNGPLNGSDPSGLKNCLQAIADDDTDKRYDNCFQSDWNAGSRPGVAGAQQFVDHAIQMVPGGGLIYMFAGYDVWGCHLSPWQRILDGANGIANAVGAADAAAGMGMMGASGAEPEMPWFSGGGSNACFVAGTPVAMADGSTKPIEQVQAGDVVASRNPQTGQTESKSVVATSVRQVASVVILTLADAKSGQVEMITATPTHPFYVQGAGFVEAGQLAIGNAIVTRAGPDLVVKGVQSQSRSEGYAVYNFAVADDHTYFVGIANGGAWVHNARCTLAHNFKPGELTRHYIKHGAEFGPITQKEYINAARSFLNRNADGVTILEKFRANGDRILFNSTTNEFGVVTSNGYIRTYFIPDPATHGFPTNLDYFNAQ